MESSIKTKNDRDGLWDALNDDRIDVVATDHAPHTFEEKCKNICLPSGLSCSVRTLFND